MSDWNWNDVRKSISALAACLLVLSLGGCGNQEQGPTLVPVSGTISVDGTPIPKAGISFRPDKSKGNSAPYQPGGAANDQGKYELIAAAKQGAPPGWYKVVVFPYSPPPGGPAPTISIPEFNKKYSNPDTTDLSIEVKADAPPGAYDLELTK